MCRARRGGPSTPSKTADANLDWAFVENALFPHGSLIVKSQQKNIIELVSRPGTYLLAAKPGDFLAVLVGSRAVLTDDHVVADLLLHVPALLFRHLLANLSRESLANLPRNIPTFGHMVRAAHLNVENSFPI